MNFVIGLILLILLLSAIKQFARMDAAAVARAVRTGGGVLGLIGAALLLLRGQIAIAAVLAGMAASFAGWRMFGQGWTPFRMPGGGPGPSRGRVTTARSAMLEMRLDHDSGFSGWREADEGQAQTGRGGVSSGAMTRREAYETLGLEEGASAEEIIRAHRSLMKKLHPDRGGSTGLAARINQAKDVLMQRHG